jgi:hypothetical protein
MLYYGESNVPGAPGNFLAGGNFMGGAGSAINPDAFKRDARQQKIYNKGVRTDNPSEKEIFLQRTGPQLPLAGIGNVGGMLAQSYPMYGDTLNMGPADTDYSNMPVIPNPAQEQRDTDALLEEYRNRVFPQQQQMTPFGFDGKYIT